MMTVLNGQRSVAFLLGPEVKEYYEEYIKPHPNAKLKVVKRDGVGIYGNAYILYTDLGKAKRLYNALVKQEGYLPTDTPEMTIENGEALEYDDADIKGFVDDKFGNGTYDKIKNEY